MYMVRMSPARSTAGSDSTRRHRSFSCPDILREFWVYSKAGTLRFFRVEDSWLLEIGRDGQPLAVKEKPGAGTAAGGGA
jgi:hypothetical protein